MKPLFFIDYDNTIFSHRTWTVPEDALQALEALKNDGFRIFLASGRAFRSSDLPEDFRNRFTPDGLVSSNGAIIEAEGKLLWEKYFDPDLQRRILDYVVEKGYCLISGFEGTWATSNLERFRSLPTNRNRKVIPEEGNAFQALYTSRRPAFFLADTKEAIEDVQAHFPETTRDLVWGTSWAELILFRRKTARVNGRLRILEYFHASWDDVIAIGDQHERYGTDPGRRLRHCHGQRHARGTGRGRLHGEGYRRGRTGRRPVPRQAAVGGVPRITGGRSAAGSGQGKPDTQLPCPLLFSYLSVPEGPLYIRKPRLLHEPPKQLISYAHHRFLVQKIRNIRVKQDIGLRRKFIVPVPENKLQGHTVERQDLVAGVSLLQRPSVQRLAGAVKLCQMAVESPGPPRPARSF